MKEYKQETMNLLLTALKKAQLVPEDETDNDVVYNFRHYVCEVYNNNLDVTFRGYQKIIDIIEEDTDDMDYDYCEFTIIAVPLKEIRMVVNSTPIR